MRRPGSGRGRAGAACRTSWNPHHQRRGDEQLEGKSPEAKQNERPRGLVVSSVPRHLDRSLLQLIYLTKDPAECLTVLGPEVPAAGLLGDLLKQRLVDSHR